MHIQPITQNRPLKAQLGSDALLTFLGKIQAIAATVISVTDAISAVSKNAEA